MHPVCTLYPNGSKAISLRSQDIRYDTHPRADSQDRAVQRQSRILGGRLGIHALRPLAELVRILPRYRHTITFYESDPSTRVEAVQALAVTHDNERTEREVL